MHVEVHGGHEVQSTLIFSAGPFIQYPGQGGACKHRASQYIPPQMRADATWASKLQQHAQNQHIYSPRYPPHFLHSTHNHSQTVEVYMNIDGIGND